MPALINNTAIQNSTTSNQGSDKMPKLAGHSYFFLEDNNFTQTAAQAFGIKSETEFCTTALVSVSGKKVISICAGQVFLQPFSGDLTKVNLILKPYRQPVTSLSVKYFIYRGLTKADFIVNDLIKETGSPFITHIRTEFNNFYESIGGGAPTPAFLPEYIGFPGVNSIQPDDALIDSYFYKVSPSYTGEEADNDLVETDKSFEFPMIPAGLEIGTANGEIGIDIVLNAGDYFIENDNAPFKFNLAFARASKNTLTVTGIADPYAQKLLRNFINFFIDPAAYYGLHSNGGEIIKYGQASSIKSANDIYTLIQSFFTKNTVYLFIQSDRQMAYNFYDTYRISSNSTDNLKIGTTETNLAESSFETDNWPVKLITTIPSGTGTYQTIALQLVTDGNQSTCLFAATANILSDNTEGFVNASLLVRATEESGIVPNLTNTVILGTPIAGNALISSFIQLVYRGKSIVFSRPGIDDGDPATPPADPIVFQTKYTDDVFYLTRETSFLKAKDIYHVHGFQYTLFKQIMENSNERNVVSTVQRNQMVFPNAENQNQTVITYLSVAVHEENSHSTFLSNISSNKESTGYSNQNGRGTQILEHLPDNEYAALKAFTDNSLIITGIDIKSEDGSFPTTMGLGLTKEQDEVLKNCMVNKNNPKIYLESMSGNRGNLVSPENILYKKFNVGVLFDTEDFKQDVVMPDSAESITVYTNDGLMFFSYDYSFYLNEYINKGELVLNPNL
jgi:hypothetical protein